MDGRFESPGMGWTQACVITAALALLHKKALTGLPTLNSDQVTKLKWLVSIAKGYTATNTFLIAGKSGAAKF